MEANAGTVDRGKAGGAGRQSVDACISPEIFDLEIDRIFKKCWLNIARADDLPRPGSFLVRKLPFLNNVGILVVRGSDGVVRGFYNACRHRGTEVVKRECGSANGFMCPFHGWTYDTRGRLTTVPHEFLYDNLRKTELGLIPVATDTWAGYVFVNLDPAPKETLLEYLDEVPTVFRDYPFEVLKRTAHWSLTVRANWKLVADSFKDFLHAEVLHRRSLPGLFPIARMLESQAQQPTKGLSLTGRHSYLAQGFNPNPERVMTPAEKLATKYRPVGSALMGSTSDGPTRGKVSGGKIEFFPNFIWTFMSDRYMYTHRFLPVAVDETLWEHETFMEPPRNAGEKVSQEWSSVVGRDAAVREDMSTQESMQQAFQAGVVQEMVMASIDARMRYHYRVAESYIRHGRPLEPDRDSADRRVG